VWSGGQVNVNSATPDVIWMLACDSQNGAPDHPICTDPEQTVTFLTTVGKVRNLMPGVPAFASPEGFIKALRGQGPFGLMAEITGLEPFKKFKAESELLKSVTTESKVFSVYATGYVKSGKRETRVRVHSVVDFRGAPKPGAPTIGRLEELSAKIEAFGGDQKVAEDLAKAASSMKGLPEGATDETIGSVFRPSPGGNIIYFRID
jgi:general secretion pathway protein K